MTAPKDQIILPHHLRGFSLLNNAQYNKGTAFSIEERKKLNLEGLLPEKIETLSEQATQMYDTFQAHSTPLSKHLMLNELMNQNQTLYFYLISQHLEEMMPIIYTPTVGEAVLDYPNHSISRGGLYLPKTHHQDFSTFVNNIKNEAIDIIVLTDGEAVLGIGDQGIAGMKICAAKLAVYTLCGGIRPDHTLPVMIDVGTNNPRLIEHPLYQGCQTERLEGPEYFEVIDQAIVALHARFPNALFHWEDFGRNHAQRHLNQHQNTLCTFNDDIQGTGAVALATILAACRANHTTLDKQTIVIFGAGTAGIGIADRIHQALCSNGLSDQKSKDLIWLIDRNGLILNNMEHLTPGQKKYAKSSDSVGQWPHTSNQTIDLHTVIQKAKPHILIGCSAVRGAFDETAIKHMLSYTQHPIILPLSNPTERSEATPHDLIYWTKGKARIATGSPFSPVDYHGQGFVIAQCNNAMIYPGIGLGRSVSQATRITDHMIWAASEALSQSNPAQHKIGAALLPTWPSIHQTSTKIAHAVATQAVQEGVATHAPSLEEISESMWMPHYPQLNLK